MGTAAPTLLRTMLSLLLKYLGQVFSRGTGFAPQKAISLSMLEGLESVVGLAIHQLGVLGNQLGKRRSKAEDARIAKSRSRVCQGLKPGAQLSVPPSHCQKS